jgi:hypothetical protein
MPDAFDKELFTQSIMAARLIAEPSNPNLTQSNLTEEVKKKVKLSCVGDFEMLSALGNSRLSFYESASTEKKAPAKKSLQLKNCDVSDIQKVARVLGYTTENYVALMLTEGGYSYA